MKTENIIIYCLVTALTIIIGYVFGVSVWSNDNISISFKYYLTGIIMLVWLAVNISTYAILKTLNDK